MFKIFQNNFTAKFSKTYFFNPFLNNAYHPYTVNKINQSIFLKQNFEPIFFHDHLKKEKFGINKS